ncbi:MAG: phosphate/phosphite/phosphonate ABC transporter substrate-binding protein [Myxococcaceae bacterium]|nr:phosphate/phosphite/phosphonate ABC transporter substrate-binding protein [Myxococcaceae bacterium]
MGLVALIAVSLLAAEPPPEPLTLVLTPYRAPEELLARYRPLADRLGAAVGRPIELKVAPDFGAAAEMLLDGRGDLAELTPYAFVNGMQGNKLQPLAADAMVGRPGTGIIITRSESDITRLELLKGKTFGFVDRFSSTGFLGPWANLQSKGFDPAELFTYRFAGSHGAVLRSVLQGELDAGAVSRHAFDQWKDEHPKSVGDLRVLLETSRMPGDVFAARAQVSPADVKALGAALLQLSWEKAADKKVLDPIARKAFVPVDVKEYAWLLRVAASIKK